MKGHLTMTKAKKMAGKTHKIKLPPLPAHPRAAGKPDIALGARIRLRRVEMKMSQHELGDRLGVSFQQIQKYEKGVNRVGASRLEYIAAALGVPVTFFYGDGDAKQIEVESLLFLDSSFSLRLLRAYAKVKDQTVQRQFVTLIESVADAQE
jgi:transcriptional regulator with XRE-family HTH domain